jgi:hypothetical protein
MSPADAGRGAVRVRKSVCHQSCPLCGIQRSPATRSGRCWAWHDDHSPSDRGGAGSDFSRVRGVDPSGRGGSPPEVEPPRPQPARAVPRSWVTGWAAPCRRPPGTSKQTRSTTASACITGRVAAATTGVIIRPSGGDRRARPNGGRSSRDSLTSTLSTRRAIMSSRPTAWP